MAPTHTQLQCPVYSLPAPVPVLVAAPLPPSTTLAMHLPCPARASAPLPDSLKARQPRHHGAVAAALPQDRTELTITLHISSRFGPSTRERRPLPALRGVQTFIQAVEALEERYVTSPRRSRRLSKRKKATPPPPPAKKRVRRQSARASVRTLRTLGL